MKVEKARITINKESADFLSIPMQHVLFVDCEFFIDLPEKTLVFINCYYENCRFDSEPIFEFADKTLGGYARNCTFAIEEQETTS